MENCAALFPIVVVVSQAGSPVTDQAYGGQLSLHGERVDALGNVTR